MSSKPLSLDDPSMNWADAVEACVE